VESRLTRRIGGLRSNSFFQPGDAAEFFQGRAVVNLQQGFLVQSRDMLDGDFDAVDCTKDAAPSSSRRLAKSDFFRGGGE